MNQALFYLAVAGPALFVTVAFVFGLVKPKYHPLHNSISELALGKYGHIQTVNFAVSGLLIILLGGELAYGHRHLYGAYAVVAMGIVLALSAIFRTDPIAANGSTTVGKVHNALFLIGMLATISAQFVVGFDSIGSTLGVFSLASGAVALFGLVAMIARPAHIGLFQRVLVLAIMCWIAGFGLSVLDW